MLVRTVHEISLQKGYDKVQYVFPTSNETYVFLAHRESNQDIFVHCNLYGKNIFEYTFQFLIDSMQVTSPDEAVLLVTRQNFIMLINLQTHLITRIPFQFMNESTQLSLIQCFSQTKYMCIVENGAYNDHRLKLSYFRLPLSSGSQPFVVFESKDNEWTHEYNIKRINNQSSIAWFKNRHDDGFEIRLHEVVYDGKFKGLMRIIKSQQSLTAFYGMSQCQCALLELYQTSPDHLMLATLNARSDIAKNSEKIHINSNFILDTTNGLLRQCKFILPRPYNDQAVDHIYLGFYSVIHTFGFENSRAKKSPVYFIHNLTEEFLEEETWECSYMYKFTVPGYDGTLLIESQYENQDVHTIKVSTKRPAELKMLGLHLLLEMYEDFDDNLLQEAIQFLPNPEEQM